MEEKGKEEEKTEGGDAMLALALAPKRGFLTFGGATKSLLCVPWCLARVHHRF